MAKVKSIIAAQVNNDGVTTQTGELYRDSVTGNFNLRLETAPGVFTDLPITSSGGINIVGNLALPADYPAADLGDAFVASNDGVVGGAGGKIVEAGELILAIATNAGGDEAAVGADWVVQQLNIDLNNIDITGGTIVGLTNLETDLFKTNLAEALNDAPFIIRGFDSQAEGDDGNELDLRSGAATDGTGVNDGSNSGVISVQSPKGGDATGTGNGGNSGGVNIQSSAGGDAVGAASVGGDSGIATLNSQQGGNGVMMGGNSGLAIVKSGEGGDSSAAGGTGGNAGDAQVRAGDGGDDLEGGSGTGGDGGNVEVTAGNGGSGDTPGMDGTINNNSLVRSKFTTEIVAFATGGQANAVQLVSEHNKIDTVATATDSVRMPDARAGLSIWVNNDAAVNSLDVFPNFGDNFKGLAADVETPTAAQGFIKLFCYVDGEWTFE